MLKSKSWQQVTTGTDGNTELFCVNVFDYDWHDTKEKAIIDGEEINIYKIVVNDAKHLFAAKEVSNGVGAFYTYSY